MDPKVDGAFEGVNPAKTNVIVMKVLALLGFQHRRGISELGHAMLAVSRESSRVVCDLRLVKMREGKFLP